LGIVTSRDSLLRLIRALPDPAIGEIRALGVDDFALRRGHVYGTVVLDMATHRPIDVLADRTALTLADWLGQHPGIEIVCRDRAGAYAEGIRAGAPDAAQVADRWHLWHNLCEAVEKTVVAHRAELCAPEPDQDHPTLVGEAPVLASPPENRLAVRTQERYTAVQELLAAGKSLSAIGRILSLDRRTVRRFAQAGEVEQLLGRARSRGSKLDKFKPYLHERWNAGCTDAAALTTEINELGYRGSDKTVRRYLQPFRDTRLAPPPTPVAPTVRRVTGWLTRHPDRLTEDERLRLKHVLAGSPALETTHRHVHGFAQIMVNRQGEQLQAWMSRVDLEGEPPLRSFVTGLRTDLDAVRAGLTLGYSSGPVEGAVNRIKMLKRQTFGRAKFDLLRKRILLA
jgi:transposase